MEHDVIVSGAAAGTARLARWIGEVVRCHWPILVLLLPAAALRTAAWLAVHPAMWILGDSIGYLDDALRLRPDRWRPSGYSVMVLRPLLEFHRLSLVTAVQHVMGLGVGVLVYATLLRLGLPRWIAALAAVPVLFDGYVLASEQLLASEPLFVLLVVGALCLLVWRDDSSGHVAVVAAGLLLGLAAVTRIVGLPLIGVAALALLLPRPAWSKLAALCVASALPLGAYALAFDHAYHRFNLTASSGIFLYGRTVNFVDCQKVQFSDDRLRRACPKEPIGQRNELWYDFDYNSPFAKMGLSDVAANDLAGQFALEAIRAQPAGYAELSWKGLVQSFEWDQSSLYNDLVFRMDVPLPAAARASGIAYQGRDPGPQYRPSLVRTLAAYQRVASVPATACLLALLVALAGLLLGRDPDRRGLRVAVLVTSGATAVLLLVPALTAMAQPRYRVPAIPAACLALALGGTLLANRWKELRRVRLLPVPRRYAGDADDLPAQSAVRHRHR